MPGANPDHLIINRQTIQWHANMKKFFHTHYASNTSNYMCNVVNICSAHDSITMYFPYVTVFCKCIQCYVRKQDYEYKLLTRQACICVIADNEWILPTSWFIWSWLYESVFDARRIRTKKIKCVTQKLYFYIHVYIVCTFYTVYNNTYYRSKIKNSSSIVLINEN